MQKSKYKCKYLKRKMKRFLAAVAVAPIAISSAAVAGPYINADIESSFYDGDYHMSQTGLHLGYKDVKWENLTSIWKEIKDVNISCKTIKQITNTAFYSKYTTRLAEEIDQLKTEVELKINDNINFRKCSGLSNEVKEVLERYKPQSFGEAKNLPGMTPAAASILLSYVKK